MHVAVGVCLWAGVAHGTAASVSALFRGLGPAVCGPLFSLAVGWKGACGCALRPRTSGARDGCCVSRTVLPLLYLALALFFVVPNARAGVFAPTAKRNGAALTEKAKAS